jgi:hypothetical protein
MTKGNARRPGRRSNLPSRTITSRRLPRLANIDFASVEVRQRLIDAGWSGGNDLEGFQLSNHIREIVSDYLADRTVSLPEFRNRVVKLARALDGLLKKFPDNEASAVDSAIVEAINHELDEIDDTEKAPDFFFVRDGFRVLVEATKRVRDAERGAGTDSNRKAYTLIRGLARIYFERTGKKPSASSIGRFARFVEAVNALIPPTFQLHGLDNLITAAVGSLKIIPPN